MRRFLVAVSLMLLMSQSALAQYGAAIEAAGALMQAAAQAQAAEAARQAAAARAAQYRNNPTVIYRDRRVATPRTNYRTKTVYATRTVSRASKASVANHSGEGAVIHTSGKDPFASGSKGADKFQ
jgi:hypothetical protein